VRDGKSSQRKRTGNGSEKGAEAGAEENQEVGVENG
jgi:hypothetical protein